MYNPILKPVKVAFIATYPPRKCGIGVFTNDLVNSLMEVYEDPISSRFQVVAMNNTSEDKSVVSPLMEYPSEVMFTINSHRKSDYKAAADYLNLSDSEVICIQHEFGIFGGEEGNYILNLMQNLKKPAVTVLHTVLDQPQAYQKEVLQNICKLSTNVVVIADKAKGMLTDIYGVDEDKIIKIHHGTPDVPFLDPSYYKEYFGAENNKVLLTFGLISPSKGLEYAIEAMAEVVKEFPDALYLILGATHPEVKKKYGEKYRISLERLVKEKKLEKNVIFHNRFVSSDELSRFLVGTDVYVVPYLSEQQISSGTLAYAVACGKSVVSTPFWYASELLADNRGSLVPFKDSKKMAEAIKDVLRDEKIRNGYRKKAYQYGRDMIWHQVASNYAETFSKAVYTYSHKAAEKNVLLKNTEEFTLPEVNLSHLQTLTDDTGLFQHAKFTIPDRNHGYCTDDNARALIVAIQNWELYHKEDVLPLLNRYISFIRHSVDEKTGRVKNFMSYDRRWLEEYGSDDCQGRVVHAIGYAIAHASNKNIDGVAISLFKLLLKPVKKISAPRAWAQIIIGAIYYLRRFGGDTEVKEIAVTLMDKLSKMTAKNSTDDWFWFEDILTYENGRIPQALIAAGRKFNNKEVEEQGIKILLTMVA